jgi:hypothetical protein
MNAAMARSSSVDPATARTDSLPRRSETRELFFNHVQRHLEEVEHRIERREKLLKNGRQIGRDRVCRHLDMRDDGVLSRSSRAVHETPFPKREKSSPFEASPAGTENDCGMSREAFQLYQEAVDRQHLQNEARRSDIRGASARSSLSAGSGFAGRGALRMGESRWAKRGPLDAGRTQPPGLTSPVS